VGSHLDATCYAALAGVLTGSKTSRRTVPSSGLTAREIEVLQLLVQGLSNPQIGQRLVISTKTVEHHLAHVYNKLGISTRTAAVAYAVHQGLARP
jgi:DNA-binding NarL/FixJ family response regulator